jgi:hypothetical protein
LVITEGVPGQPNGSEVTQIPLPCPVQTGFVVLFENPQMDPRDPHNWSDVLIFNVAPVGPPPAPGILGNWAILVSDSADAAGNENGMDPVYFQMVASFPLQEVLNNPLTVYIAENPAGPDNFYAASGPSGTQVYDIVSDPPEPPTPTQANTWSRVKATYR